MDKNTEALDKAVQTLEGLEKRLSFIADAEGKLQSKSEALSSQIDDLFRLERDLEEKAEALSSLITDVNNAIHRFDELKESLDATLRRLEKLDVQGLRDSLEETTDAVSKSEKAIVAAQKRNKEASEKLIRGKK